MLQHVILWSTFHIQTRTGTILLHGSSLFYSVTVCHLVNGFLHEAFEIWCNLYILIKTKYISIYENWLRMKVSFSTYYINIVTTPWSSKDAGPGDRKDVFLPTQSLTVCLHKQIIMPMFFYCQMGNNNYFKMAFSLVMFQDNFYLWMLAHRWERNYIIPKLVCTMLWFTQISKEELAG